MSEKPQPGLTIKDIIPPSLHSENTVIFHDEEYPQHFVFFEEFIDPDIYIEDGTKVGESSPYLLDLTDTSTNKVKDKKRILVWSQGMVIEISQERFSSNGYRHSNGRNGNNSK